MTGEHVPASVATPEAKPDGTASPRLYAFPQRPASKSREPFGEHPARKNHPEGR
jgi:hypothetical protein